MEAFRTILVFGILASVSGCASTINALTNRPITSDHLDDVRDANKLKSVSGDRRLVRVQKAGQSLSWIICAETQADAIAARGAQSSLTINGRLATTDGTNETLVITNARGQISDVVRQLAWQICNAHLNGAYDANGYASRLDRLQVDAMAVLMAGTTTPAPANLAAPVPGALVVSKVPAPIAPTPEAAPVCKAAKSTPCPAKVPTQANAAVTAPTP